MGNTGSAHNLHNDCIDSELNSYYTQQYLRRTTGETKKKHHNQAILGGWSSGRTASECKVLPKPSENLKLRATTNGAILQAGGTISFRANKDQLNLERNSFKVLNRENEPIASPAIRRSHTLILDGKNTLNASQRKSALPVAEFSRSQTLLHFGYHRSKCRENNSPNLEQTTQTQQPLNTSLASTLKVNKYNKKRKAPLAPIKKENNIESKKLSSAKPRIYTTNSNKIVTAQQQHSQTHTVATQSAASPFQRDCNMRNSENFSRLIQNQQNSNYASKLPYRREKSFDAVLLRQREKNYFDAKTTSTQRQIELPLSSSVQREEGYIERCVKKEITANKTSNTVSNNFPSTVKLNLNNKNTSKISKNETERMSKYPQSRIPQLKRTFYFGMEASNPNKPSELDCSQALKLVCKAEEKSEEEMGIDMLLLSTNIKGVQEELVDNGILVHVRPTLPRRQPETPSFSPAAAWRNLLEEQQRLQQDRSKPKHFNANSFINEPLICLSSNTKDVCVATAPNWTPEQDLEDDEDDEDEQNHTEVQEKSSKTSNLPEKLDQDHEQSKNISSLHIFSLSLPRDVHLQSQMKSSTDYSAEQENCLKAANCWLVPGFNSLQKFKTHLGYTKSNCTCTPKATVKRSDYHLQTIFGEPFLADTKNTKAHHQRNCGLNKKISVPGTRSTTSGYHNDNWLLHKSKTSSHESSILADKTKTLDDNSQAIVNLEPKSLTNVCGGKHIVYLPGQESFNNSAKEQHRIPKQNKSNTTKSSYKRQRQRQAIVRESLQDLNPIHNIHQSNVSVSDKNTHRFSFQSTVRVLEKRRLAEKLSKDAEIQEAQRINELEAMKRVEEDFQRKRAPEKANLRNQLRLHLNANAENEEYRSLPLNINERYNNKNRQNSKNPQISDVNNNLFCRAEPDGAVSPSLDFNDNLNKMRHSNFPLMLTKNSKELEDLNFDGEESASEPQVPADLQHTALLIQPYLHSII